MENFFSIKQAASLTGLTAETLRHYDRTGLVRPAKRNADTGYRYYTENELVRLGTVHALRCMDFGLQRIKDMLESEDFGEIVGMLEEATENADRKIADLQDAKARIERAKRFYASKAAASESRTGIYVRTLPERVILLSDTLHTPTVENLTDYHRHFFAQTGGKNRGKFAFEDAAGVYETHDGSHMFAVCTEYADTEGLIRLPGGEWLCAECTDVTFPSAAAALRAEAERRGCTPPYTVRMVALTGILQWKYELQLPIPQ